MTNDLKNILLEKMKERGIKIPALSKATGIPKDRIYKWYSEGSSPKAEDSAILQKWINNGKIENVPREISTQTAQDALINMLILELAKVKSKVYGVSVDDAIDELEKNARIALRQLEKGSGA